MRTQKILSIVSTVVAITVMASVWMVGSVAAADGPAPIVIKAQDCCSTGQVVVDSAVAPQDGWLGLFKDSNGSLSSLVGYTPVHKGQNTQFTANINSDKVGQAATLWAGFLVDFSGTGVFNLASVKLAPNSPLVGFATTATAPAVAPTAPQPTQSVAAPVATTPIVNQITVKAQDCCSTGQVVVDSAVAPQDGWLGLFKNSNGSLNSLVGYTPVHKGQNTQFTVDINSDKVGQAATLWAGFLVDFSGTGVFNLASVKLAPNSPLVGFATTATAPAVASTAPQPTQPVAAPVATTPIVNQITVKAQDCCSTGQVVVDSAVATQDGWLGLFKDSNGSLSSLVGYTPVHKGQNTQFTANINSDKVGQAATLWAGFLVDFSGTGVFNLASVKLAPNSPLVGFATTAAK